MANVVIIGAGPAGVSAALYTARAGVDTTVLTKGPGALARAEGIENYYGVPGPVSGAELERRGIEGAEAVGVKFVHTEAVGLTFTDKLTVETLAGDFPADAVILATGASRAAPPVPGLAALEGRGFSVTLLCSDGAEDLAIAEIIRNGLTAAGVEVTVESHDSATRDQMINDGNYQFALVGNGGWGNNPPTYMRTLFSDTAKFTGTSPIYMGAIGYSNPEMTALAEAQAAETDFDARVELFRELELLVSQEIPIFVIANQSTYSMYRTDYYDGWMKTYAYQQAEQNRLSYMAR